LINRLIGEKIGGLDLLITKVTGLVFEAEIAGLVS
jgi:hypothetical protein